MNTQATPAAPEAATARRQGPAAAPSIDVHHQIVVVGGGTAGITVAARLGKALKHPDVAVVEPSEAHYYQPMWTLVGAGVFPKERSMRSEASVMPRQATWIKDRVAAIDPDARIVTLEGGKRVGYDYLVVAPGIQIDWGAVKGLPDALGTDGVCSIYDYRQAERTWQMIQDFEGGEAVFTSPSTPIKCGGAPQKIMYLADDAWRKTGVRKRARLTFATAGSVIFGVKGFRETLQRVVERKDIHPRFKHDLIEIRPETKEAVFRVLGEEGKTVLLPYDFLHVSPPMSAPDFIKRSKLAYQEGDLKGWLKVDKHTLQHLDYPNVFGAGDVAGLPTAKTGAAVRKQAPVLVRNLLAVMSGKRLGSEAAAYDGYSSCPLLTGYGKMVLAEFAYGNEPAPSLPIDTTKERYSMYLLKLYGLPFLYWNLMLKGRA